jgi:hypothetical protein
MSSKTACLAAGCLERRVFALAGRAIAAIALALAERPGRADVLSVRLGGIYNGGSEFGCQPG